MILRTMVALLLVVAPASAEVVRIEVKARAGDEFGGGAEAVTRWKQRRLTMMALDYLARHRLEDTPCRFDVVTVDVVEGCPPRLEIYENAFNASY